MKMDLKKQIPLWSIIACMLLLGAETVPAEAARGNKKDKLKEVAYRCDAETVDTAFRPKDRSQRKQMKDNVRAANKILKSKNFKKAKRKKNRELRKEIKRIAHERKKHLLRLIRSDPDNVLSELLTSEEREDLNAITENCVEAPDEIEGTLEVVYIDDFENGNSDQHYTLETADKKRIRIYPILGERRSFISGMKVRIKGLRLDNDMIFDGRFEASQTDSVLGGIDIINEGASMAQASSPAVFRKTLVVIYHFQNTPPSGLTVTQIENNMNEVRNYYLENSYGSESFQGHINPDQGADVYLLTSPIPISAHCSAPYTHVVLPQLVAAFPEFLSDTFHWL